MRVSAGAAWELHRISGDVLQRNWLSTRDETAKPAQPCRHIWETNEHIRVVVFLKNDYFGSTTNDSGGCAAVFRVGDEAAD